MHVVNPTFTLIGTDIFWCFFSISRRLKIGVALLIIALQAETAIQYWGHNGQSMTFNGGMILLQSVIRRCVVHPVLYFPWQCTMAHVLEL